MVSVGGAVVISAAIAAIAGIAEKRALRQYMLMRKSESSFAVGNPAEGARPSA
jgi:hypothetical protein